MGHATRLSSFNSNPLLDPSDTLLLPFLDASNPLHGLFPPREWAVRLPALLFVVGLAAVGTFIGMTIIAENRKKAQRARLRTA